MVSLSSILDELSAAKDELMAAQAHYSEAATDTATAKANLDFRRAELLSVRGHVVRHSFQVVRPTKVYGFGKAVMDQHP